MKTSNTKHQLKSLVALGLLALGFGLQTSFADLTATVTPGYTFGSTERPTTSTLNRLGTPSIVISGTIGGTNAGLAAGSVNGSHLAAGVVDGVTISFTNSSPQALRVRTPGLAGPGLTGATEGGELTNNVDGVRITITNDVVTLATNIPLIYLSCPSNYTTIGTGSGYLTNISLTAFAEKMTNTPALITVAGNNTNALYQVTNYFTSTTVDRSVWAVSAGADLINEAHGLGAVPRFVRAVLVCTTAELDYSIGDEVSSDQAEYGDGAALKVIATATHVIVRKKANANVFLEIDGVTLDRDDWSIRVYAKP